MHVDILFIFRFELLFLTASVFSGTFAPVYSSLKLFKVFSLSLSKLSVTLSLLSGNVFPVVRWLIGPLSSGETRIGSLRSTSGREESSDGKSDSFMRIGSFEQFVNEPINNNSLVLLHHRLVSDISARHIICYTCAIIGYIASCKL